MLGKHLLLNSITAGLATICLTVVGCTQFVHRTYGSPPPAITDPAKILALADLTLPKDAGAHVSSKPLTGYLEDYYYAYTVTWVTKNKKATNAFLTQTGDTLDTLGYVDNSFLDGWLIALDVSNIPEGSKLLNEDFRPPPVNNDVVDGNLSILVDAPDFTTIHVGVAAYPNN